MNTILKEEKNMKSAIDRIADVLGEDEAIAVFVGITAAIRHPEWALAAYNELTLSDERLDNIDHMVRDVPIEVSN